MLTTIDQEETVLSSFHHAVWNSETSEIKSVAGGLEESKTTCAECCMWKMNDLDLSQVHLHMS